MSDIRHPIPDASGAGHELRLRRRVAFAETDAAGIVHFSNYLRYFEDAEHALWRHVGLSVHTREIGWPRVSVSCEYHRALRFEQEFEIGVRIAAMSARSIRYEGTITLDGAPVATAAWKTACVNQFPDGTMKSMEIPSDVADRLKPFAYPTSSTQPPASA